MEDTNWRQIPEFPNYRISQEGEIVSFWKNKPYKISYVIIYGNYNVQLWDGWKNNSRKIYVLMAETWIDNPEGYKYIIFKDKNNINIHKNNLMWTDNPYNYDDDWETIKDFPKYEICINGVRNKDSKKHLGFHLRGGYTKVGLYNDKNEYKKVFMHVLIAKQYIPNPDGLPEVNHKNGIKQILILKILNGLQE